MYGYTWARANILEFESSSGTRACVLNWSKTPVRRSTQVKSSDLSNSIFGYWISVYSSSSQTRVLEFQSARVHELVSWTGVFGLKKNLFARNCWLKKCTKYCTVEFQLEYATRSKKKASSSKLHYCILLPVVSNYASKKSHCWFPELRLELNLDYLKSKRFSGSPVRVSRTFRFHYSNTRV